MDVIIQYFAVPAIAVLLVVRIIVSIVRQRRRIVQELAEVRALGDSADAAAICALDAFERHANAAIRAAATESLARVHEKLAADGRSNIGSLLALLKDSRHAVRYAAVKALQNVNNPKSAKQLASLLNDGNEKVRLAVTEALASLGPSAKSALLPLLADKDDLLCKRVAQLLLRIGVPDSDPIFEGYKARLAEQRRKHDEERRHTCSVCGGYAEKPRTVSAEDMRRATHCGYEPARFPPFSTATDWTLKLLMAYDEWTLCELCAADFDSRASYLLQPSNCDFCGVVIRIDNCDMISLNEMKRAVSHGFDPRKTAINLSTIERLNKMTGQTPDEWFQAWRQDVLNDDSDWFVCKVCSGEFKRVRL